MTYNILDGADGRLEQVAEVVRKANPDVLIINEANGFDANDNEILEKFAKLVKLSHYHLEKCGDGWIYHVAIFAKLPLISVTALHPVARGIICAQLTFRDSTVTVVGLHLSPFSEEERLREAALLLPIINATENLIVMGDFNSLPAQDTFTNQQLQTFPGSFQKKFAETGTARYETYDLLEEVGLTDVAAHVGDYTATIPTRLGDTAHPPVRLDRALVSAGLAKTITQYEIIKNPVSDFASDHYPVVIAFNV